MNADVKTATSENVLPWWAVLIEGIALLILGALLFANTAETTLIIVQVLGLYWLVAGLIRIIHIFVDSTAWGWKLAGGIVGIVAGILVLQHPLWSPLFVARALVIVIAIQGIVLGLVSVVLAFQGGGWGPGILGAVSVMFGVVLLVNPELTLWVPLVLGGLAFAGGVVAIAAAFLARRASA
jgi:uncharacterized membrane protein HdeD (DUF308 family)